MPIPSRPSPDAQPKLDHDEIVELGDDDIVLLEDDGDDIVVLVEPVEAAVASRGARNRSRDAGDASPRSETRASKPFRRDRHLGRLAAVAGGAFVVLTGLLLVITRSEGARRAGAPREAVVAAPAKAPVAAPGVVAEAQPVVTADAVPAVVTETPSSADTQAEPSVARAPSREAVTDAPNLTADAERTATPEAPRATSVNGEPSAEGATETTPSSVAAHPARPRIERSAAQRATETTPPSVAVHPSRTRIEGSAARSARLAARIEPAQAAPAASDASAPVAAAAHARPEPASSAPAGSDASASAAAAPSSPAPGSGDLPMLPSRAALRVALTSATTALRACTSHRGIAMMTLTLSGDGSVRSGAPVGSWGGDVDRACVERAIARVRVPAFARPSLTLRFPFVL